MRKTSDQIEFGDNNLWLIDERLSFHNEYLGSEKSLASMPITDASGGKTPDILSLNVYENPHLFSDRTNSPHAAITVVELKRPMRDNFDEGEEKDPIQQALGYLKRIRNGGAVTRHGRKLPNALQLPGFVYVIADLTASLIERCELASLTKAADGLSYFGHNRPYDAYIEVIDYEGVVKAATERNSAFFDKLGLPTHKN
jgi:hypothetical protein